jgi:hypothetical protein
MILSERRAISLGPLSAQYATLRSEANQTHTVHIADEGTVHTEVHMQNQVLLVRVWGVVHKLILVMQC